MTATTVPLVRINTWGGRPPIEIARTGDDSLVWAMPCCGYSVVCDEVPVQCPACRVSSDGEAVTSIPLTTLRATLRQIVASDVVHTFDLFFPMFRKLDAFVAPEQDRGLPVIGAATSSHLGRGRERRFAGDRAMPRGRYSCLVDSPSNRKANNTLLGELFAYADPTLPVGVELLDTTVDSDVVQELCAQQGWSGPSLIHIIKVENPWVFPPALGIPPGVSVARYPVRMAEVEFDRVIDLRLPWTLKWAMHTFMRLEATEGLRLDEFDDRTIKVAKAEPPTDVRVFIRLLLSQQTGGGSTFIQAIGAWMREHGVAGLVYPSARSDSLAVVRDGVVVESFGYIFVDYRAAPPPEVSHRRRWGLLPSWREPSTKSIDVELVEREGTSELRVSGVRWLQSARFGMYQDWTQRTLERVQSKLHEGEEFLSTLVRVVVRSPGDVLGPDGEAALGEAQSFIIDEGGGFLALSGFLLRWRGKTNAAFVASVLPVTQTTDWAPTWEWDERSWFLHRKCLSRPWLVVKCPVCFVEQFWNVQKGVPRSACLRCSFSNGGAELATDLHRAWAGAVIATMLHAEDDARIYSAACERAIDAVTGAAPSSQEEALAWLRMAAGT